MTSREERRLAEDAAGRQDWRLWATCLPERQWSTVREDCSPDGGAWNAFPYDMSRRRAHRWGEDVGELHFTWWVNRHDRGNRDLAAATAGCRLTWTESAWWHAPKRRKQVRRRSGRTDAKAGRLFDG